MVAKEVGNALGVGVVGGQLVDLLVEQLRSEMTQHNGFAVAGRLQLVDEVDEGRLGIVGEAAGHGGDVDEVVWLEDDEFGKERAPFEPRADKVDLGTLVENFLKIGPVVVVAAIAVGIADAGRVAFGPLFHLGVDVFVVPALYDDAHAVADQQAGGLLPPFGRESAEQRRRHGCAEDEGHEAAERLQIVEVLALQLVVGKLGALAQPGAQVVDVVGEGGSGLQLLQQVVGLGEGAHEVELRRGGFLVETAMEDAIEDSVDPPVVGRSEQR